MNGEDLTQTFHFFSIECKEFPSLFSYIVLFLYRWMVRIWPKLLITRPSRYWAIISPCVASPSTEKRQKRIDQLKKRVRCKVYYMYWCLLHSIHWTKILRHPNLRFFKLQLYVLIIQDFFSEILKITLGKVKGKQLGIKLVGKR